MFRFLIATCFAFLPSQAFADCDFVTSQFSKELQNPESVERIDIEIKKSRKWAMNGLKMILDDREFIHPKWKKKFKATVQVTYSFGTCTFSAKVRQNGDWRDHQEFKNGELRQSLDVGLKNGNISNVVDFKLFLPHTRNGNNETLATLILQKLGILAPKTFLVDASVNGREVTYLFQEKESKELLEALGRREGPIFKGDEALLWSFKGFEPMDLLPVSAARLANHKWARRGESSAKMALSAYIELQLQYMHYASLRVENNWFYLNPNERLTASDTFPKYHAAVAAFGGWHALWGINRKTYWNALAGEFEPIYYDGNVSFDALKVSETLKRRPIEEELFRNHLKKADFKEMTALISAMQSDDFIREFAFLAKLSHDDARSFAIPKLTQMLSNLGVLEGFSSEQPNIVAPAMSHKEALEQFIDANESFGIEQRFVAPKINEGSTEFTFDCLDAGDCEASHLGIDQVVDLMSKQKYEGSRIVILPVVAETDVGAPYMETRAGPILVKHGESARVEYDSLNHHLKLYQMEADDWFLIKNTEIENIAISLIGRKAVPGETGSEQRFNQFGLTGCLTFYKVAFENANITVSDGVCEDSLNIVSSHGSIKSINIINGFSDAIDLDFSQLEIENIKVDRAGNDCFDVSGGEYSFLEAKFKECGDKGISVGENSSVRGERIAIETASIGASSKDYSDLTITQFTANNVQICLEAFQKKEEFGGGKIEIKNENCDRTKIKHDSNSIIVLGGERFELSN